MLAVKRKQNASKKINITFFFCIYLLIMPKYWGEQIFRHGSFPEMGQKQITEGKKERERKKERAKVGNNYGQLRIATPLWVAHAKPPGPKTEREKDRKLVITMASYALQRHLRWRTLSRLGQFCVPQFVSKH